MAHIMDSYVLIGILACSASGLLAGALVTEAFVLVPFWRRIDSKAFLGLHSKLAPILFRFFAPLTVAGATLPLIACVGLWVFDGSASWLWSGSAACGVALIGFYFGFFQKANLALTEDNSPEQLLVLLSAWATMHNVRTVIALIGFVFAVADLAN